MADWTEHDIHGFFMRIGDIDKIDPDEVVAAFDLFMETIGCSRVRDIAVEVDYDIDNNIHRPYIQTRFITAPGKNIIVPLDRSRIRLFDEEKT